MEKWEGRAIKVKRRKVRVRGRESNGQLQVKSGEWRMGQQRWICL